jgi:hypothetical protein
MLFVNKKKSDACTQQLKEKSYGSLITGVMSSYANFSR